MTFDIFTNLNVPIDCKRAFPFQIRIRTLLSKSFHWNLYNCNLIYISVSETNYRLPLILFTNVWMFPTFANPMDKCMMGLTLIFASIITKSNKSKFEMGFILIKLIDDFVGWHENIFILIIFTIVYVYIFQFTSKPFRYQWINL